MTENATAGQGPVVLDIGGAVGALVVTMPAALAGAEVEICPVGRRGAAPDEGGTWWSGQWRSDHHGSGHGHHHGHGPDHGHGAEHGHDHGPAWPHVAALTRSAPSGRVVSAVFPGLRTGHYELWVRPDGPTALEVEVVGGRVTEADWPSRPQVT